MSEEENSIDFFIPDDFLYRGKITWFEIGIFCTDILFQNWIVFVSYHENPLFLYKFFCVKNTKKEINTQSEHNRKNRRKNVNISDDESRDFFWKEKACTQINKTNIHHKPYPRVNNDTLNGIKQWTFWIVSIESVKSKNNSPKNNSRNYKWQELLFWNVGNWELYPRYPIGNLSKIIGKKKNPNDSTKFENRGYYRKDDFMSFHAVLEKNNSLDIIGYILTFLYARSSSVHLL